MPTQERQEIRRKAAHGLPRQDQLVLTGLVLVCFLSCVVVAFYFAQVLITGYRVSAAEKELTRLRIESNDLYAKVNQLASLENVEAIAVHKLGMVKPDNNRIVLVHGAGAPATQNAASKQIADGAGQTQRQSSWLIRTFSDMVSMWETSIKAG